MIDFAHLHGSQTWSVLVPTFFFNLFFFFFFSSLVSFIYSLLNEKFSAAKSQPRFAVARSILIKLRSGRWTNGVFSFEFNYVDNETAVNE